MATACIFYLKRLHSIAEKLRSIDPPRSVNRPRQLARVSVTISIVDGVYRIVFPNSRTAVGLMGMPQLPIA
ncbi:hypothetical protein [Baaleninema sp.]|uniref:hypothetical protein n=1 Tax=Baaleninema sp. TaxID=3101197 RepID=UPI003CFF5891